MPLILAGRLALTIARIPGLTHQPLSAEDCSSAVRKASAGVRAVDAARHALELVAPTVVDRGKPAIPDDLRQTSHAPAGKLDVLLRSKGAPKPADDVKVAYVNPQLPDEALFKPDERLGLPDDVLIASPELAFLVESKTMQLPVALIVALELCGTYDLAPTFLPAGSVGSFLTDVKAIMTPASLVRFVDALPTRTKGRSKALAVSKLVVCGSASPMESRLYCALSLPVRCGGYGIKGLKLNEQIPLSIEDRSALGTQSMRVDIMASSGHVGIEYDSRRWHECGVDQNRIRLDKKRIAVARFHGVTLLPLTWDVVRDPELFHHFAREFMRIDETAYREPSERSQLQRSELHRHLFGFRGSWRAA